MEDNYCRNAYKNDTTFGRAFCFVSDANVELCDIPVCAQAPTGKDADNTCTSSPYMELLYYRGSYMEESCTSPCRPSVELSGTEIEWAEDGKIDTYEVVTKCSTDIYESGGSSGSANLITSMVQECTRDRVCQDFNYCK